MSLRKPGAKADASGSRSIDIQMCYTRFTWLLASSSGFFALGPALWLSDVLWRVLISWLSVSLLQSRQAPNALVEFPLVPQ